MGLPAAIMVGGGVAMATTGCHIRHPNDVPNARRQKCFSLFSTLDIKIEISLVDRKNCLYDRAYVLNNKIAQRMEYIIIAFVLRINSEIK